jgi:hypothetical protein
LSTAETQQCAGGLIGSYAYVWLVQDCPNGCVMTDAGVRGTGGASGGPTGSGGTSGGLGGTSGFGGAVGTGGRVGGSAMCQ